MANLVDPEPMLVIDVAVGPPQDLGAVPVGGRRFVPIVGGAVSGAFSGTVVPGGADWQTVRASGMLEIDARYVLDLAGRLVEVSTCGVRHASPQVLERLARGETVAREDYYFRTAVRFATAAPDLTHLNAQLAIGVGERLPRRVRLSIHAVL
jgi:hypothetical protein